MLSELALSIFIATAVASPCAKYHIDEGYDPSGCMLNPDGTWHIFPDGPHWGHCTSTDLFHWNCSHPSTHFDGDTGSITVTSKGVFALWPTMSGPQGVLMATPMDPLKLDKWAPHGIVGVPPPNSGGFRDPGRAMQLKSGWFVPGGVNGPHGKGGGIHWFRDESDGAMTNLTHMGWLYNSSIITEMECPDVFALDGKVVVIVSTQGVKGWTQHWVGVITDDDLHFHPDHTDRLDFGANGKSTIYAAKTGTNAYPPFTRRVVFGFSGWSDINATSSCGSWYLLPKELSISTDGKLLQYPVKEAEVLRKARVEGSATLAAGAQIEMLASCSIAGGSKPIGVVGMRTLLDDKSTQGLMVGYNFSSLGVHGFAKYDARLGGGQPRTDSTSLLTVKDRFEFRVFVDGHLVESFFDGTAVITAVTNNTVSGETLKSAFVNTASDQVACNVTSWVLGLTDPEVDLIV